jgi:hypothetical protein
LTCSGSPRPCDPASSGRWSASKDAVEVLVAQISVAGRKEVSIAVEMDDFLGFQIVVVLLCVVDLIMQDVVASSPDGCRDFLNVSKYLANPSSPLLDVYCTGVIPVASSYL